MTSLNEPPNLQIVYQAIYALYQSSDQKQQQEADKWLDALQKSMHSWTIADQLLQENRDCYSTYFAARTLRYKVQNSFLELPAPMHEPLRYSLGHRIAQMDPSTDNLVLRQLSLAIADLALYMVSWRDPIGSMLDIMVQHSHVEHAIIQVLTYIPEEASSRTLRLGHNRRTEVMRMLKSNSSRVMELLEFCMNHVECGNSNKVICVLECFEAWMRADIIELNTCIENVVVRRAFQMLANNITPQKLHDCSRDCILAMLDVVEREKQPFDEAVLMHLFHSVVLLEPAFLAVVSPKDSKQALNYCRIFTALCEAFLSKMLVKKDVPHYSLKALDLLLLCMDQSDYELAEITFNVWHRLSEKLFDNHSKRLGIHFMPYFKRLFKVLCKNAMMTADHEGLVVKGKGFADFRSKILDRIQEVAFVLGRTYCTNEINLMLQHPGNTWEVIEALLFVMQSVAAMIASSENEVLPKIVEAIFQQTETTHIAVRYTSIRLLGELSYWIDAHPEFLEMVLNFLLQHLQQCNRLQDAAAESLASICTACCRRMVQHMHGLMEIVRNLEDYKISNEPALDILQSVSVTLSLLPHDQILYGMYEVINLFVAPLANMVDNSLAPIEVMKKGEPSDPVYWIDRICIVVRYTNPCMKNGEVHPTSKILIEVWPLLSRTMEKYQKKPHVIENICQLFRYGLRMVKEQFSSLVVPLINQMIVLYGYNHHSCLLYIGSLLVGEFREANEYLPLFFKMLQAFTEPTYYLLQQENGPKNNPDIVDDFFRLCSQLVKCHPLDFLRSGLILPVFQCALICCKIDHYVASSSVMEFFTDLLVLGKTSNLHVPECCPLVKEFIHQHGETLIDSLIQASVLNLHAYTLLSVAVALSELRLVMDLEEFKTHLNTAVNNLPKTNMGGTVTATQEQCEQFSLKLIQDGSIKNIKRALENFARLFW